MRDNYNCCTPPMRLYIIVAGCDEHGWATYEIRATSEVAARMLVREMERRRQDRLHAERENDDGR